MTPCVVSFYSGNISLSFVEVFFVVGKLFDSLAST